MDLSSDVLDEVLFLSEEAMDRYHLLIGFSERSLNFIGLKIVNHGSAMVWNFLDFLLGERTWIFGLSTRCCLFKANFVAHPTSDMVLLEADLSFCWSLCLPGLD
jgi:hypothetical protein